MMKQPNIALEQEKTIASDHMFCPHLYNVYNNFCITMKNTVKWKQQEWKILIML